MIIYMGLPTLIYPQVRNIVYHPKVSETIFPSQPILQQLASDNCFLTITENNRLTSMQKNLLREWLSKPVRDQHPVFKTAEHLQSLSDAEYGTSGDFDGITWIDDEVGNSSYVPEYRAADNKKRKREKKQKKQKSGKSAAPNPRSRKLGTLAEENFEESYELMNYKSERDLISFESTSLVDV